MNARAQSSFIMAAGSHHSFRDALVPHIPQLRAFARALCVQRQTAEDLTRKTLATAWGLRGSLEAHPDLKLRLFTILRTEFHSLSDMPVQPGDLSPPARETGIAPVSDRGRRADQFCIQSSLHHLPAQQREALILIAAAGFSYAQTAKISNTRLGTVKSRVARGRLSLSRILAGDFPLHGRTTSDEKTKPRPLHNGIWKFAMTSVHAIPDWKRLRTRGFEFIAHRFHRAT